MYRKARIVELIKFDKKIAKANSVIGVDEVGRGPVAGPVTACAVYFPKFNKELSESLQFLDDSKKFSSNPKLRQELAEEIKRFAIYNIQDCTVEEIEKFNILQASLLAMKRACENVLTQIDSEKQPKILVDGKFKIKGLNVEQEAIIKGDSKSSSIAAASILAKVHRDNLMIKLAEKFPQYNWQQNKGYPTKAHLDAIVEFGTCEFHRKSFLGNVFQQKLPI